MFANELRVRNVSVVPTEDTNLPSLDSFDPPLGEGDGDELLDRLEHCYCNFDANQFHTFALGVLGFTPETIHTAEPQAIEMRGKQAIAPVLFTQSIFDRIRSPAINADVRKRCGRIANVIAMAIDTVSSLYRAIRLRDSDNTNSTDVTLCPYFSLYRFEWMVDHESMSDYQNLLIFLLQKALSLGYRKMDKDVYCQKYIDGVGTHSWEYVDTIQNFVFRSIDKDVMYSQWLAATSGGSMIKDAITYLTNCYDTEFRPLIPDRRYVAFQNGIYDIERDEFHVNFNVSDDVVAMQFIDYPLDTDVLDIPWWDVPTPDLDSIFLYQDFQNDGDCLHPETRNSTLNWTYALLGRLLYEVGTDNWQVAPFFIGVAGCGKSTVCTMIKSFFHPRRVSTISSNMEGKFGLASLVDSDICIAPEVTKNFPMDRGVWQSAVVGERLLIPRKNMTALDQDWKVPILMAGNEPPDWEDKSKSVRRRMIPLYMRNRVLDSDPGLLKRIMAASPQCLVKLNRCYRQFREDWGDKDVWSPHVFPEQMHNWQMEMLGNVDILSRFIKERCIVRGDLWVPEKQFKTAFFSFKRECSDGGGKSVTWTTDFYHSTFTDHNVTTLARCDKQYRGRYVTDRWCMGIDIIDENDSWGDDAMENGIEPLGGGGGY